jgi:transmembrane sensor
LAVISPVIRLIPITIIAKISQNVSNKPPTNPIREQAVAWFLRLQAADITAAERRQFLRWFNENPKHQQAYDNVERHWQWLEPLKTMPFVARNEALNYRPKPKQNLTAYAAAALLVISIGLSVYWQQSGMIFPKTYQVAKGEQQTIKLADGSSLELNTDTAIRVTINPWRREVELLHGEAYFQVAHDNKRHFRVKAGRGIITDIGTAFEVYRQPGKVLVAVQEGIVDIQTKEMRRLTAHQQIAYTDNGEFLKDKNQPIENLTAWRHGQLIFQARRLDDALAEIARYHNKQIRLGDSKLAALRISGVFPSDRLDSLLTAVTRILPVQIERISENEIVIKRATKS